MNLAELGDVIVGFRPEHFRPVSTVTDASVPSVSRSRNIEIPGSEWICFRCIDRRKLDGKKIFSRLSSAQNLQLGGSYDFAVPSASAEYFDRSSENTSSRGPFHGGSPQ